MTEFLSGQAMPGCLSRQPYSTRNSISKAFVQKYNQLIFQSWVMSKHMRFFKHEIPLDLIKAFSASDMYTAEWIMFITHFTLPLGSASGEILSRLMQSELWTRGNWNIWPGFSAVPQEVGHEMFRSEGEGTKVSPQGPVCAGRSSQQGHQQHQSVLAGQTTSDNFLCCTRVQRGNCSSCILVRVLLRAGDLCSHSHTAAGWWSSALASSIFKSTQMVCVCISSWSWN